VRVGFFFGTAVILDQVTKLIVRKAMDIGESYTVLGQFLRITYVENPGIAFGIRVGDGSLFTILSLLASVGVIVYLITHWDEGIGVKGSLALILGGAFGNLIDRIVYRQVVDFIDVGIKNIRWPVFNLADTAVVIGMVILFWSVFMSGKKNDVPQQEGIR
jgi:signal peptidase II